MWYCSPSLDLVRFTSLRTWYLSFLLHRQHYWIPKFTPENLLKTLKNMNSKIYVVFVFNLENFTPDRIFLQEHHPGCPWQLSGMPPWIWYGPPSLTSRDRGALAATSPLSPTPASALSKKCTCDAAFPSGGEQLPFFIFVGGWNLLIGWRSNI